MAKPTEIQIAILTHAAQREDGAILPLPDGLTPHGGALTRTLRSLEKHGFIIATEADDGGAYRITETGRAVITQPDAPADTPSTATPEPKPGTKKALLVDLLRAEDGVPIDTLTEETGWLPHTVRAALTGLRKQGFAIARGRDAQGISTYRLVG